MQDTFFFQNVQIKLRIAWIRSLKQVFAFDVCIDSSVSTSSILARTTWYKWTNIKVQYKMQLKYIDNYNNVKDLQINKYYNLGTLPNTAINHFFWRN